MPPNVGDEYIIIGHSSSIVCKIMNTYEESPGKWIVVVREPETGTLLKRTMKPTRWVPRFAPGGAN